MHYLKTFYLSALAVLAITAGALPIEHGEGKFHNPNNFHARTDFDGSLAISAPARNATALPTSTKEPTGSPRDGWPFGWSRAIKSRQNNELTGWCFKHGNCNVASRDQIQSSDLTGWPFGRSHMVITDASEN